MRQSLSLHWSDVQATRSFGGKLGRALLQSPTSSWVIYFNGELGAGKTTLIGALLTALGHVGAAKSPTYTLIEPYELAGKHIAHTDLYRLVQPQDAEALALKDLLEANSILLIEWAERGVGFVPPADFEVNLAYRAGDGRQVQLYSHSTAGAQLIHSLQASESLGQCPKKP